MVLADFGVYQTDELIQAGAPFLLLLALFDLVMIDLVWQEWRALRGRTVLALQADHEITPNSHRKRL